jgi:hypothetical protein
MKQIELYELAIFDTVIKSNKMLFNTITHTVHIEFLRFAVNDTVVLHVFIEKKKTQDIKFGILSFSYLSRK